MANILFAHTLELMQKFGYRDLTDDDHIVRPISLSSISDSAGLDKIVQRLLSEQEQDMLFVDGNFAYSCRLRQQLIDRGITSIPLIIAYFASPMDEGLQTSGSDYGTTDTSLGLLPSDIVRVLSKNPIPVTKGLLYNTGLYGVENGNIVRK